jgi:hypothetical protein
MSEISSILFILGGFATHILYSDSNRYSKPHPFFASTYIEYSFLALSALTYGHSQYFHVALASSLPTVLGNGTIFGLGYAASVVVFGRHWETKVEDLAKGPYVPEFTASA